ncbi:HNH endonuclease [Streptomyces exfoliatus]|uniref:HNH endonuclease n=1 Tax=Streptomyces exfoliatus TaxID=1905 RepID=UPI003C2FDA7F
MTVDRRCSWLAPPLGEPRIEARVCPVCLREGLVEGRTRHQRCEGRSLARESTDPPSPARPQHADQALYRALVRSVEAVEESGPRRTEQTIQRLKRRPDAREAVLVRSGGHCENPGCAGQPSDVTDSGQPILEVDHIVELAAGGRDHPEQMVALCPNCHAVKTRGRSRESLRSVLLDVAARRHKDLTQ